MADEGQGTLPSHALGVLHDQDDALGEELVAPRALPRRALALLLRLVRHAALGHLDIAGVPLRPCRREGATAATPRLGRTGDGGVGVFALAPRGTSLRPAGYQRAQWFSM